MTDVGVAVTDLRVVCKIITCVSAFTELEMAILTFLEIVKAAAKLLLQVWALCVAGYAKDALWALTITLATGKKTRLFGMLD